MAENLKKLSSAGLEARLDAAWAAGDDELAAAVSAELARRSEYASPDAEAALAEFYGVYAGEPLTSSKRVRRMKKRKWLAAVAALFVLLLAGTLLSPQRVLATGVQESGNSIKVFVGTRSDMFGWLYDFYQRAQINGFYRDDPEVETPDSVSVVSGADTYYAGDQFTVSAVATPTQAALRGVKPCIIGIILATGGYMVIHNCIAAREGMFTGPLLDWQAVGITAVLLAVCPLFRAVKKMSLSPVSLIFISACLGVLVYGA